MVFHAVLRCFVPSLFPIVPSFPGILLMGLLSSTDGGLIAIDQHIFSK
jgi:hypothetical protein